MRPFRPCGKGLVFQYSAGSCNICYRPVSAFNKFSTLLIIRGIIFGFSKPIFVYLSTVSENVVYRGADKSLARQKILSFIYPIHNHIGGILVLYIYIYIYI